MIDSDYLKALANGLGLKNTHSLSVIMGPNELKEKLSGLTLSDFDNGIQLITLHTHTTASDGQVRPEYYLDNAENYRKKYGYRNLIVAVTDHDTIKGLSIILKTAVQNQEKYKHIRLVLGCELSVSYFDSTMKRPVDFELLHYGINPFDSSYNQWLDKGREIKRKALSIFFKKFKDDYPKATFSLKDFLTKHPLMKDGFGCYLAYITPRYLIDTLKNPTENNRIWDYFRRLGSPLADDAKMPFWHTLDEVINQLKKHQFGFLSLAHPYRIQLEGKIDGDGPSFLTQFLSTLKRKGVQGLEIFYMNLRHPLSKSLDYMLSGANPCYETDRWVKSILDFADNNNMIKTGGTDSHTSFLGGRKRQIVVQLTDLFQGYKPLIKKGYHILNKEMTLGLPAPCMPAESCYLNTGIGSAYGNGENRIASFFEDVFHKIQLGPMGQTNKEAKHSPYVSELKPNPFLIPLEKLAEKNLISPETMDKIYDIPKADNCIDFEEVEKIYSVALTEAWKNSKTTKTKEAFIAEISDQCARDIKTKFIADLQVKIPSDTPNLTDDLFLPNFSLGSPPDQFSNTARNWHFKVFRPDLMFDSNGELGPAGKILYNLVDLTMKNAKGGLRIDHYIGFVNPFVISDKDPTVCGRLYSSPHIPELKNFVKTDFSDITKKIILDCSQKNNLTNRDIYVEDIGSRPEQLDQVMADCKLGRLLVAEFAEPSDWGHIYHLKNAQPLDVAVLDTHDTPSIQTFFKTMPEDKKTAFAYMLTNDLRFNYTDDLHSVTQLIRMQWGALLACPAERIQAFFTSWIGQEGRYNQPGNPVKWKLRCVADFEQLYFKNLALGLAYNPFDAIALAIYARGDEFYAENSEFVKQLREAEDDILELAKEL